MLLSDHVASQPVVGNLESLSMSREDQRCREGTGARAAGLRMGPFRFSVWLRVRHIFACTVSVC